jgi:hypothetical protein
VTTAWAIPVVTSFSAGPAYATHGCLHLNQQCGVQRCTPADNQRCIATTQFGTCCSGCLCQIPGTCVADAACTCQDNPNIATPACPAP